MDLLERYNRALRTTEDGTITLLNRVLDQSFNRLIRRVRVHLRAGYADPVQRNLAVLQELRQLVPVYNPQRTDAYDKLLRNLVTDAHTQGMSVAEQLTERVYPDRPRINASIPLEATFAAAAQARGYLQKHGTRFAETSAEVVAQGVLEGRPTDAMIQDMRTRLGITKGRAETIVRTESIRAYSAASNTYYAAQGISQCIWYTTADDRTCPLCSPRAGKIYKRGEARTPAHPRCRCTLAPWDSEIASMDPEYAAMPERHAAEVAKALQRSGVEPVSLNTASVFEQQAPQPITG